MKTGIVAAGGSLKGIYNHIGFFIALEEMGIVPDAIMGTSAGAVVGGYIAAGGSVKRLKEIALNLKAKDYIDPHNMLKLVWMATRKFKGSTGLIKGKALENLIRKIYPVAFFEETPIPFYAHTVNISTRCEEILCSGELAPAVRASASIPFVFEAAKIKDSNGKDNYYVDGGVVGHHALDQLARVHAEMKCVEHLARTEPWLDVILVNDFHKHKTEINNSFMEKEWTPYHLINRIVDCMAAEYDNLRYQVLKEYNVDVISIRPDIPYNVELKDPSRDLAEQVINYSVDETFRCLKELNNEKFKDMV